MTNYHKIIVIAVNKEGFKGAGLNSWEAGLPMAITPKAQCHSWVGEVAVPKRR